ncbi:SCAN domain-containing protein 3 [Trichonephila clavipes]|uniref:SCAN domain-containing protein 3 n=1 Tax=Trichonephila clavipes TaxID=2585209 RepID=A0A8X6REF0_TRICX|nr:SCAN domain-containing protein 3 [Trichonephila clavipes]
MDKWLKRRKFNDNSDNDNVRDQVNEPTPGTSKNTSCSKKYVVHRKYNDDFLKFGFTSTMENDIVVPECMICGFKLSNSAMVPSKLQRHLVTNHPSLSTKDKSYFERSLSSKIKQVKVFEKQVCVSEKAQVASYEIAELIAVNLKPHNLAEEIILPACRKIVKTMIGGSADIDICKIPLSNDTIHRRIKDMSENIEQNTAKTLANSNFALQVDETTDITGNAQLIAFFRFIHENDIINPFLCCRELPDFTTGKHIFQVISSYLEEIKVSWKSCIDICTDDAPAMSGHLKGFVAHVKELNEDILVTHCFVHREALVTKFLPSDLKIVLEQCVKMVNYIKSRPLKSRLFSKLCQAMEAKYESLLLHTEVRWLSRGKVISRVLKLKDQMKIFFEQNKNYEFVHLLEDKIWCTKLAYLSDIFVIFNNINSSMQGPNENILNSTDKLVGFKKQITLWKNKAQEGNLEKFESVPKDSYKTIKLIVVDHLTTFEERIIHYFPKLNIKKFDWARNPFLITYTSVFDLTLNEEEELILLSNNRDLILKHSEESDSFWINIRCDYPMIAKKALNILLQFSTSYLCEFGFSALANIKTKKNQDC